MTKTRFKNAFKEMQKEKQFSIIDHDLWVILHHIYELLGRYEDNFLEEFRLNKEQYLILWVIKTSEKNDNSTILSDVTTKLFRKASSTSSIINRMVKNGLVKKFRDLPDQRAVRLELTPKGEELINKSISPFRFLMQDAFSIYSDEEKYTMLRLLERFRKRMIAQGYFDIKKPNLKTRKLMHETLMKYPL